MHPRNSIVNLPLLAGIILSVTLHGIAVYSKGIYTPPQPQLKQGRTVVLLTLIPRIASPAAAPKTRPPEPEPVETDVRADPISPPSTEPIPAPDPAVESPSEEAQLPVEKSKPHTATPPEPQPAERATESSLEQNASAIEDKGVTSEARSTTAPPPQYPRISRIRNEEGKVILLVQVLSSGEAGTVRIISPSQHKRLDAAAVKAVQKATFIPALQFGQPVDSELELTYTFTLTDE
ncbi:MAG: TonB family protein [Pontiella sp.]